MIYFLYNFVLVAGLVLLTPLIIWRMFTHKSSFAGFWRKLWSYPACQDKTNRSIWIHAVSVGEVMAALPLVKKLREKSDSGRKIVMTVTTPTGRGVAIKKLSDVADVLYFPYDFPFSARRAVRAINPSVFITIDTEIWPNIFKTIHNSGAIVAMVNGRISDRSFPRYGRFGWFFKTVFKNVDYFFMQTDLDAKRICEIGAAPDKVEVIGNMKFDNTIEPVSIEKKNSMRRGLGISPDEKVIFLGAIHSGEERAIRAAVNVMRKIEKTRLVIAPRRIENIEWIEKALAKSALVAARKTGMSGAPDFSPVNVPVIDTFGQLALLYAVADVAFVGGSFIEHGGQNPLEPSAHGIPVLFGRSMSNFRDASRELINAGAGWMVSDENELETMFTDLICDNKKRLSAGSAGISVIEKNRGAADRVVDRLIALLADE